MKTKNVGNKLTLNKKTVAHLDSIKMDEVKGGGSITATSGHIVGCYCDSIIFCTCPGRCPI